MTTAPLTPSQVLHARGMVHQHSTEHLSEILDGEKRTIYLGVDPSSDSLTVGNLAMLVTLRLLKALGHDVILLVGGGTGMIGDPKPDVERPLQTRETILTNTASIKKQMERILNIENLKVADNYEWLGSLNLLEFLRDVGKYFTVNSLVKKDAIANRMDSEEGITYTEFTYPLLQGYDFYHLYKEHGCNVQVGGSDQWGNIIAGVDLIRKKSGEKAYCFTAPLIIDRLTGKKFGKSEGNAVWLDPEKTSPFAFYQFFYNTSDVQVEEFLMRYTDAPITEVERIMQVHNEAPQIRYAQSMLAAYVTELVHGSKAQEEVTELCLALFNNYGVSLITDTQTITKYAPTAQVQNGTTIVETIVISGLATSNREARQFITDGSIHLTTRDGSVKITTPEMTITDNIFADNGTMVLRRGKQKAVVLVKA